jgi:hypothetical protein
MTDVAVIAVDGLGNPSEARGETLRAELQKALAAEWSRISFQSVDFQELQGLRGNQSRVFGQMERHLGGKDLRQVLLDGLAAAACLERSRHEANGAYVQAQLAIAQALRVAYRAGARRVVMVAQSLGGQVVSNYVWDAQHSGRFSFGDANANGIWAKGNPELAAAEVEFLQLKSLYRLFTTGCSLPMFVAGYDRIVPFAAPQPDFRWFNFYDADDVLGWPLQPLSEEYAALVEDIPCNVGKGIQGLLPSWNPLSHSNYWGDRGFLEALVTEIRKACTN